jgi:hypothetical protein
MVAPAAAPVGCIANCSFAGMPATEELDVLLGVLVVLADAEIALLLIDEQALSKITKDPTSAMREKVENFEAHRTVLDRKKQFRWGEAKIGAPTA